MLLQGPQEIAEPPNQPAPKPGYSSQSRREDRSESPPPPGLTEGYSIRKGPHPSPMSQEHLSRKRNCLSICAPFPPLTLLSQGQVHSLKHGGQSTHAHRRNCRRAPRLPLPAGLWNRGRGPSFSISKKMAPKSRAPAALHPRGPVPNPAPVCSSDYLVFSSFTRITLQKPRSVMLLWKRDSCQRGGETACLGGPLQTGKEKPLCCPLVSAWWPAKSSRRKHYSTVFPKGV